MENVKEIVDWRLCLGCGVCAIACPQERLSLWDYESEGIRPRLAAGDCGGCRACLDVCPAFEAPFQAQSATMEGLDFDAWGPVLEIWEGYAADPDIRFKGSSGGALSAIGAYCLERLGMHGVLHIGQDPEDAVRNRTRLSRTRSQLLEAAGSRYAPASVGNGLKLVEEAPAPCVVIGKPSEIAGVRRWQSAKPERDGKVGATLSFFCAESPATAGTVALVRKMGLDPGAVETLRYRGHGWPGHFAPILKGESEPAQQMSYRESWGFLQAFRPWSVQMWPDFGGELADISCGDPWYETPDGKNPGFSMIVVRTAKGAAIIRGAIEAGYLKLTPAEPWKLVRSQGGLLKKKGAIRGRRLVMRALGLPVTGLGGMNLKHCWGLLSMRERLKATLGTLRRILTRGLRKPLSLDGRTAIPVKPPTVG